MIGRTRTAFAAAAALAVIIGLSGCVAATPTPEPTPTGIPSQSATPDLPNVPVLHPGGTAAANQQFFDSVNAAFFAANGPSGGRPYIDNLVASGFRKQDMEVTPDRTSIDLPVDSIVFSVRVKGECLVGQISGAGYKGIIAPLLATGHCLVGATRPIDW